MFCVIMAMYWQQVIHPVTAGICSSNSPKPLEQEEEGIEEGFMDYIHIICLFVHEYINNLLIMCLWLTWYFISESVELAKIICVC